MQQTGKRICALLLVLCMLMGVLPASVLAEEVTTRIVSQQLSLGDDLTMHFYGNVSQAHAADAVVNIAVGGAAAAEYTVKDMAAEDGVYDFAVDLGAAQMTEQIVLTLTSGGETVLEKTYSVQNYAHALLEGNYSKDTKAMVKELLNYGAKAQLYFDHKTDDLANAGYEIETTAAIAGEAPQVAVSGKVSGVRYHGATMVFESKIAVRYYFQITGNAAYTVTVNDVPYDLETKGDYRYVEVSGINPQEMDTVMTVKVSDGTKELSFNYSPMYYITRMYNKEESGAELKALLAAANGYFEAAEVFAGVKENRTGSLSMAYRYGTNNLIQINTDLPSDTPCVNFLATDNGCSIDQSANQYQQFSWVGMENVDGTIVLTFNFNQAFEAGQTYVLPKGAVFGFTDESKYTLDKNYTFTFDGSGWTMEAKEPPITLTYRWGNESAIQFNTNLPADIAMKDFLATDNGCNIIQGGNQQVGYVSMLNADGTIVLTFNFNNAFTAGQCYTLAAGSVFGFTDGSMYELYEDITLYWDGSAWTTEAPVNELSLAYRWGSNKALQFNTDLPADIAMKDFLATDNGCNIIQGGNQQVGYVSMLNADGTIVLTFNFNNAFTAGQSYTLAAGSVFGFTDGSSYTLDRDYAFYFDGSAWSTTPQIDMSYRYGAANLIQFNTNLPADIAMKDFLATDNGCNIIQGGNQQVGYVSMLNADGTIVLTFNFNNAFTVGQSYTLAAGSVFGFTDGSVYKLYRDVTLYWNGSEWSENEPADVLDASNFTGGEEFISFADLPVDSTSVEKIEEYKGLGLNTSLLAEDHTGAQGPDERYTVSMETANGPSASDLNFQYRYGTSTLIQVNTNLPATTPTANFTADANGCIIDQSANQYQQVGWIGMDNVDGTIVLTFHFNAAFKAGQTYVLPKGALFAFTDGSMYLLDKDYTFIWDGSNWHIATLEFSLNTGAAKYIQLKTNIPTGLTYGDFLVGDTSKGNVILETTEGAQAVGWFSYSELSGAVYLTFNFNGYNKPGTQYILKAGTTLKAGDNVYTTDRDYILTVNNDYLTSLENLDNAGLNVWIRNYHNREDYFTENLTATLLLYKDMIDGFYMADEAFETNALLVKAGQESHTSDLESLGVVRDWFNNNFADKYFHMNHVPIHSYDHYTDGNGNAASAINADHYRSFLQNYKATYNDQLTNASGASISFDNYPFVHAQGQYGGFLGTSLGAEFESGIQDTYLLNCLIAAQVAGEDDFGLCIQTFEATDLINKTTRDITSAAEVSLQLYTGMAMGADLFEYFAYNSNGDFDGIMNQDGTKRIYALVAEGNKALAFHDVINTFTWNGIMTSTGSVNSHNSEAFESVANMVLADATNGVLSSVASTDDAIVGCFAKDGLNGYMAVNFNDPAAVTGNNNVTLSFANCTRARVYTIADGVLSSQLVDLTNGSYTATLVPGGACFVIPA